MYHSHSHEYKLEVERVLGAIIIFIIIIIIIIIIKTFPQPSWPWKPYWKADTTFKKNYTDDITLSSQYIRSSKLKTNHLISPKTRQEPEEKMEHFLQQQPANKLVICLWHGLPSPHPLYKGEKTQKQKQKTLNADLHSSDLACQYSENSFIVFFIFKPDINQIFYEKILEYCQYQMIHTVQSKLIYCMHTTHRHTDASKSWFSHQVFIPLRFYPSNF